MVICKSVCRDEGHYTFNQTSQSLRADVTHESNVRCIYIEHAILIISVDDS